MTLPLIAIDGPAGAGKSTTSREVARRLGIPYLDTGALYRGATWYFINARVKIRSNSAVEKIIKQEHLFFTQGAVGTRIWVRDMEITSELRAPELTRQVGPICELPAVRKWLVNMQRTWAGRGFGIMEGRDIGTVVLPDAGLKIYLTARPEIRAGRRGIELGIVNDDDALSRLTEEIGERDRRDAQRMEAPLRPAEDAVTIDTSDLSFTEQVQEIIDLAGERFDLKVYG